MRKILAICDLEVAYASHFMEHMNSRRKLPFSVQAFSKIEEVELFIDKHPIEILLVSESALKGYEQTVHNWPVQQVIVLAEGFKKNTGTVYPTVSKYQSSDSVIREVMAVYAAESKERVAEPIIKRETKVIGVYSPVGRCQKTTFAMILGQLLAKERSVLYLNLESFAGFEELFSTTYDRTLSDILYHLRENPGSLIHQIGATVCTKENLDYIPPVPFPQDLITISAEEWSVLIEVLRKESVYEIVIVDIGDGIGDVCPMLELCDYIYMPIRSDSVSESKIVQFEKVMAICSYPEMLEKIEKIKLPYYTVSANKATYLQQLQWSEFGDYIRKLIRKEQF